MSDKIILNREGFKREMKDLLGTFAQMALDVPDLDTVNRLAELEANRLMEKYCIEDPSIVMEELERDLGNKEWTSSTLSYYPAFDRLNGWPDGKAAVYRWPWIRYEKFKGELICIEVLEDGSERVSPASSMLTDEDKKAEDWTFCCAEK